MNAKHRGHRPKLIDPVRKREECIDCGVSWIRGQAMLGPCQGPPPERAVTPVLGIGSPLRDGLYRGPVKEGT